MYPDCDADTLLVLARPDGPACHRGTTACFDTPEQEGFLGKLEEGERRAESSDLQRFKELFLPPQYREEVFNFVQSNTVSKEQGIGRKTTGEGMIAITNWHLFLKKDKETDEEGDTAETDPSTLIDRLLPTRPGTTTGNELKALDNRYLRGTELEYLHDLKELMIINDEAHHVHENDGDEEDVQWQQAIDYMMAKKDCRIQLDFSATPYEQHGSGRRERKVYFPHIIVDFDLIEAMQRGLVKTLSLDQRQSLTKLEDLDFNAVRDGRKVISLSDGQKLMLRAGLERLNRLEQDFKNLKHPKMMVVCEDTKVTPFVESYLITEGLAPEEVLRVDSDSKGNMKEEEWKRVSERLGNLDKSAEPRVVVSVMMLREGFDVNNICVIVPLRSSESSILLEQVIGRGLRLMWREPEYDEAKQENRQRLLVEKREPLNYMDILFIVEHPRFKKFYEDLIKGGVMTTGGEGDPQKGSMGDIIMAELKENYEQYDIDWVNILRESEELLKIEELDITGMRKFDSFTLEQLRQYLATDGETFVSQAVAMNTTFGKFVVKIDLFTAQSYKEYLQKLLRTVTHMQLRNMPVIQIGEAIIIRALDQYIRTRLFSCAFDPFNNNDWKILLAQNGVVTQHIVKEMATLLFKLQQAVEKETAEVDRIAFSSVEQIPVREQFSAEYRKTIYTRTAFPSRGGGLEHEFMDFIDSDSEVERWIKISETRHSFASIAYMRDDGLLATYHPDFIVLSNGVNYLIETKGDDKTHDRNVQRKRVAATEWCKKLTETECAGEWQYVIVDESNFYGLRNAKGTFGDIVARCIISSAMVSGEMNFG